MAFNVFLCSIRWQIVRRLVSMPTLATCLIPRSFPGWHIFVSICSLWARERYLKFFYNWLIFKFLTFPIKSLKIYSCRFLSLYISVWEIIHFLENYLFYRTVQQQTVNRTKKIKHHTTPNGFCFKNDTWKIFTVVLYRNITIRK